MVSGGVAAADVAAGGGVRDGQGPVPQVVPLPRISSCRLRQVNHEHQERVMPQSLLGTGSVGRVNEGAQPPNHSVATRDHKPTPHESPLQNGKPNVPECHEGDEEEVVSKIDEKRERIKSILLTLLVFALWGLIFALLAMGKTSFRQPDCSLVDTSNIRSCKPCGSGTNLLPLYGEYERTWSEGVRAVLYFFALFSVFQGMGLVCDQFMAAIEEITSREHIVWHEVRDGAKHKFHVKVWNDTVANLTLMALGSSAPEILLSAIELVANDFYSGSLGASTIIGSAAFNLFGITSVCVMAIPAPETKKLEGTGVFAVTATVSLWAYIWVLVVLVGPSPERVDTTEALVTLAFFPFLVGTAYVVDRGWLRVGKKPELVDEEEAAILEKAKRLTALYGKELPLETVKLMAKKSVAEKKELTPSKSQHRKAAMSHFMGGSKKKKQGHEAALSFGFTEDTYTVLECAGSLQVTVVASSTPDHVVRIRYFTREGTAKEGKRYRHVEGVLSFGAGNLNGTIDVPIIDNDEYEPEEEFYLELADDADGGGLVTFNRQVAVIQVLNDDMPGTLAFDVDEVQTRRGQTVTLSVHRSHGVCGDIAVEYETNNESAIAGRDYERACGTLKFADGEEFKLLKINILNISHAAKDEKFKVVLTNASPGVLFDKNTDGGEDSATCDIVIVSDQRASFTRHIIARCINIDRWKVGFRLWRDQFSEAVYCGGHPREQASAKPLDWALHAFALPWKVLFVLVPPPILMGGWACFCAALVFIGFVTALAGDLASMLGCCLTIPDEVTAITLVALGTSVPDTFASRLCAQQDKTADNAIGNITGSNSVNVFLGLGLSWTIGAFYWDNQTPDESFWNRKIGDDTFRDLFYDKNKDGGFFVKTGTLTFSVTVYTLCAFLCLGGLWYRRVRIGGELGGTRFEQRRDGTLLILLWFAFLSSVIIFSSISE